MAVTVKIQDIGGNLLGQFIANATQSIAQQAGSHGINIPIACCHGACFVCNCSVKSGNEYVQIDKITTPSVLPKQNEKGQFTEIFACVGGIRTDAITSKENFEVILEKQI